MAQTVIGVIGGSGLYAMEELRDVEQVRLQTPFGEPSDAYVVGYLGDVKMVFLPRHGRGHRLLPSEVPYRANIYGMKMLGVERIISVSAVGSMKEEIAPGDIVIPHQFFDRTSGKRAGTFFGNGICAHVQFADPVCLDMARIIADAARSAGANVHEGGTYICIEGPMFSTRAESRIFRSWGVDVIGMTNLPEARLAREAQLCYTTVALATDYDCWYEEHGDVSVEAVLEVVRKNVAMAQKIIATAAAQLVGERRCDCPKALRYAVMTDDSCIPAASRESLALLIGDA